MKKRYGYIVTVVLLGAVFSVLAAQLSHAKNLVIGFSYAKPPYVFAPSPRQTGDRRGIELEIVEAALAQNGHKFEPYFYSYNQLNDALKSGKVDAIATVRPELDWPFYSDEYVFYHNFAITRAETKPPITGISSLSSRSIVAWEGASKDLGKNYAKAVTRAKTYQEVGDQQQQVLQFLHGRVNTLVIDGMIFRYWANMLGFNPDDYLFHSIFGGKTHFVMGFTSKSLRDDFSAGLRIIQKNGTYDDIYRKYHAPS